MIHCFKIISLTFIFLAMLSCPAFAQTDDQINDFAKAAKFDDVAVITSLLSKGVSPNTVDAKGNPMLNLAIKDKSTKVTELLINDKRTDVDLSNKYGETPLMIASIDGDLTLVKTLVLQKKAMVNHIGWTPSGMVWTSLWPWPLQNLAPATSVNRSVQCVLMGPPWLPQIAASGLFGTSTVPGRSGRALRNTVQI